MLPHRKNWVFRAGIDNPKFASTKHNLEDCTFCHVGGDSSTANRAVAHAGMQKMPGGNTCFYCHTDTAQLAGQSLHVKPSGFVDVMQARNFDFTAGSESLRRFTKQCTKCHIHNDETPEQAACGNCHVSVPNSAGGGLVAGHRIDTVPDTINQCTACHGSRVKDEYFGQNQALFTRNLSNLGVDVVPADHPLRAWTLQPDVHNSDAGAEKAMACNDCHYKEEMHGAGAGAGIDRYGITGRTQCVDCHGSLSSTFHTTQHVNSMSCNVCHSQPYKQCYGCHTQERNGVAYFTNNESDPTRVARRTVAVSPLWSAATTYATNVFVTYNDVEYKSLQANNINHQPDEVGSTWWRAEMPLPAGDALITFRIGNNPKFGEPGQKKYSVLRHVPIDADTFTYTIDGVGTPGLVPNLTGAPTWKYATPHNIVRRTPVTTDPDGSGGPLTECGNCHSSRYSRFWLTDSITDSFGWVPSTAVWETEANRDVVQPTFVGPERQ